MTKTVRKIALLLVLIMVVTAFAACSPKTPEDSSGNPNAGDPSGTGKVYNPNLPDANFNGYTFTFGGRGDEAALRPVDAIDIVSDGTEKEVVSEAIYKRNTYIKDKYNCEIDVVFVGGCYGNRNGSPMTRAIQQMIDNNDDIYDALISTTQESIGFAMDGWVVDLHDVPNLDLTAEWWDQTVARDLDVGSKLYFATGDIMTGDRKGIMSVVFNKRLAGEFEELGDHYQTVTEQDWTLEKFYTNARLVSSEVGNDGYDENDQYGYLYWQDAMLSFISGTGNAIGRTNHGLFDITADSASMISVWTDMIDFLSSDAAYDAYANSAVFGQDDQSAYTNALKHMFEGDYTLYAYASVEYISQMRQYNADFGILPNPKLDETQKDYISATTPWAVNLITVPVTNGDLSRTGHILEAMAAKGKEMITPAFYEVNLKGKSTTDYQSSAMLDLLFSTRTYDVGNCFSWGGISHEMTLLFRDLDSGLRGKIQGLRPNAEKEMEAHMKALGIIS